MNDLAVTQDKGGMLEQVLIKGDLTSLTPEQRGNYYLKVCDSVGLNPLTKPFEYITLNNKLVLYALRACTDQLRGIHKVSVEELVETEREGVFIVTAKVRNGEGRTDVAKGAVSISNLKGEALANALMKAETKAKRRATLSICGLGMLDETEIETIASAIPTQSALNQSPYDVDTTKAASPFKTAALRNQFHKNVSDSYSRAITLKELIETKNLNKEKFEQMQASGDERDKLSLDDLTQTYLIMKARLIEPVIEAEGEEELLVDNLTEKFNATMQY